MGTHRKFFPVSKMPWHADDHKFGERTLDLPMEYDMLEGDEDKLQYIGNPRGIPIVGTVCLVDGGRCLLCPAKAVYAFRSKLYCATCWLEMDEDYD